MAEARSKGAIRARPRDLAVAGTLVAVFFVMLGASYAAVPLYKLICRATGINGTTQRVATNSAGKVLDRTVTVHFDANTGTGMPWRFRPDAGEVTIPIGETAMATFTAVNLTGRTVSGSATFNVTPEIAGKYFDKIQCFCFSQQTLKAGESATLPVTFYVDPALVTDPDTAGIHDITLSYTFFEAPEPPAPKAAAQGAPAPKVKRS